jgi:hypothetical protein
MGAVHGVYLKYVALSGLSIAGCVVLMNNDKNSGIVGRMLLHTLPLSINRRYLAYGFGYSAIVNGSIALVSLKILLGKYIMIQSADAQFFTVANFVAIFFYRRIC